MHNECILYPFRTLRKNEKDVSSDPEKLDLDHLAASGNGLTLKSGFTVHDNGFPARQGMKVLLTIAGCIALALAVAGLFLPLLPTTPFLLLASACFVRGSKRLHRWLHANRLFGVYLQNYEEHRAIPRKAKICALVLLWGSMSYSIWLVGPMPVKLLLAAIGLGVTIFLLRMKTTPHPNPLPQGEREL
jgi:uncharacterized membrane protein YbaN (DUF454 family)